MWDDDRRCEGAEKSDVLSGKETAVKYERVVKVASRQFSERV